MGGEPGVLWVEQLAEKYTQQRPRETEAAGRPGEGLGGRQGSGDHKAGRQQRAHPNPGGEEPAGVMDSEGPGGQRLWRGPSPGSSHHAGQAHGDRSEPPPPPVWAAGLGPGRAPRGGQGPPWELLDPSQCGPGSRRLGLSTAAGDSRVYNPEVGLSAKHLLQGWTFPAGPLRRPSGLPGALPGHPRGL